MPARSISRLLVAGLALGSGVALAPAQEATQSPGPLTPAESLAQFTVPADLALEEVLAEPTIRQPIFATFDERGRMWVVEYIQYPFPAGLKILSEDRHLRATYDKVPPPPPNHFLGEDRISIHEDTDGDGRFDTHKVFIEGLNIATSIARGRGGVWILNPPYLLFYPDRDGDDLPDGDPEVRLAGFGLEDTHSNVNSLQWGPDGWLYAAQGSTVSGDVVRPGLDKSALHSLGQLIWRYHPEQHRYEIFAEGGGNAFGLEIDSQGRVYSGHNGGDTRGFHYVQGGYFQKGFTKHGPLSNPYTFGYFPAMKHASVPRFTHQYVIYEGAALPDAYRGALIGVAPLLNYVVQSRIEADGSTYQTTDVGFPMTTTDPWFRPVHVAVGPDGALYVSDMYEGQIGHLRHHEGLIDKSNGRIYRLKSPGAAPLAAFDLAKRTSDELVDLLSHENKWFRREGLRLLADRRDASVAPRLASLLSSEPGQLALEALWALNLIGAFDEPTALAALGHANPFVRAWAIRLIGDRNKVAPAIQSRLVELAALESHVQVRSQLASTAKRLPATECLAIVHPLMGRSEDAADPHVPLLLWWAIESKADADREAIADMMSDSSLWSSSLVAEHILHRLMRRYAQSGTRKDLLFAARLFSLAPDQVGKQALLRGFEEAFQGRSLAGLPDELVAALSQVEGKSPILAIRQRDPAAIDQALTTIADESADAGQRLQYVQLFGEVREPRAVAPLVALVGGSPDDGLKMAALASLQAYDDPTIAAAVLGVYGSLTEDVKSVAQTLLAGRAAWAVEFLGAVDAGRIDPKSVPLDVVRKLTIYKGDGVADLVARHWGSVEGATTEQMRAEVDRLAQVIAVGGGNPYGGKTLFLATCGKCHKLFADGGQIGPDLTSYKRDDVSNLLLNVVNPSAEIREGFETVQVVTADGRLVVGFLVERDNQVIVLRGADGVSVTIPHDEIEDMAPAKKSLMPEGVVQELSDEQVRDLVAYLRSSQPLPD